MPTEVSTTDHQGAARQAVDQESSHFTVPGIGPVQLPPPDRLAWYGGVAALALLGLVDWPVAAGCHRLGGPGSQPARPTSAGQAEPSLRPPALDPFHQPGQALLDEDEKGFFSADRRVNIRQGGIQSSVRVGDPYGVVDRLGELRAGVGHGLRGCRRRRLASAWPRRLAAEPGTRRDPGRASVPRRLSVSGRGRRTRRRCLRRGAVDPSCG